MYVRVLIGIVVAGCLCSCSRNSPKNQSTNNTDNSVTAKDTLIYTYHTIKERAPDCGNKQDSSCTVAKITYPVFTSQASLNDTVTQRLLSAYSENGKQENDLHQQAKSFIKFYTDETSRNTEHPGGSYNLESSATVIRQDSSLATVQIDRYSYAGAAHASEFTGFINWDTKENKSIKLDDVLLPGYEDKLAPLAQKAYFAQDTTSLDNTYSMVKKGRLVLTTNFLITPIGLSFLYNEYELKPYSEGQTTILIPYVQIKSLLRPNTVISQYIKE